MSNRGPEDDTPLMDYVTENLWANPEENQQYQVSLVRISDEYGWVQNFSYMHKWRTLPKPGRYYHIFSVAGLAPGYWNFKGQVLNRNPLDRWVNLAALAKTRALQVDVYDNKGFQFSRGHTWVMVTQDGLTLIAMEKLLRFPILRDAKFSFRCYTPSKKVVVDEPARLAASNPFHYESMVYENGTELATLTSRYNTYKAKAGYTAVFHNGVIWTGAPNTIPGLTIGDLVEFWHDPTVIRTELYQYRNLADYYSDLDKKRKVILHPAKRKGDFKLRYFDDNDYYLLAPNNKGLYFNRNNVGTIRQLTHADVSIADDAIRETANGLRELNDTAAVRILVLIRETDWELEWPHEHQRIRYLYRMPDADIIRAFTGARANMQEWTANGLESGPVISFLRRQWSKLKREDGFLSLGYNAATRVLSEGILRTTYSPGERGVEVPVSYRDSFTAWEHNEAGHLLGYYNRTNSRYYAAVNPECTKVEFTFGQASRIVDTVVTNENIPLDKNLSYRVYTSSYSVVSGELVGKLTDVTGKKDIYIIENNLLIWKGLDPVNQRGVIFSNKHSLAYTFQLEHIDHSLAFALTEIYEDGGLIFPHSFAQVDLWLNGHPLIDNVDWIFEDQYCYINNKEFLIDGPQTITVRAHGFHGSEISPNRDTELGFLDGGVIGRFDRYNLRADRTTRTVINGSLYLTDEVPRAERSVPDDQWNQLNGRPYMVKHVYAPLVEVVDFDNYPGYSRSRELDKRVSDYLTEYLPKPLIPTDEISWEGSSSSQPTGSGVPVIANLQDKYRLYSPFMNVVVNGILNGLIEIPELNKEGEETAFSDQDIEEAVSKYKWWLNFDPVILNYDRRYFAIMPYANFGKLTVTSKALMFIKQVNTNYLQSVCVIEGHFTVNNN